ncbi:MAG: carbamate kinase [Lewinellaceae bacterium]|nr:carbamate kinase [Lewinellaceae bacterium]
MDNLAIVAIGGNSIIRDEQHQRVADQYEAIQETAMHLAELVEAGYQMVVTHGNGPQVGFILSRSEIAYRHEGLHHVPLVSCVADTQGALGYQIQQALGNELRKRGIPREVATLVTQVKVSREDPSFARPTKPIGAFYAPGQEDRLRTDHPDWAMVEDAGRGLRRVVPSPLPLEIVEINAIKVLVANGYLPVAAGGGGIPVVDKGGGQLEGVDAVIDKDLAAALLASQLGARLLLFSTGVEQAYLNYRRPEQEPLGKVSRKQLREYMHQGHFAAGSMLPKVQAALFFLDNGGKRAIITRPECIRAAIRGEKGTQITT